jgi:phosphoribosyl 1,2-cyclic phosphodiesterase
VPEAAPSPLRVCVLASGSKGNCTYVGNDEHGVLVDAGISAKQVLDRLDKAGLGDAPLDAVLLTHEHRDHVQGARVLSNRLEKRHGHRVPFLATSGTAGQIHPASRPAGMDYLQPELATKVGAFEVQAFAISHDTADPVGYRVELNGWAVAFATDLGRSTATVEHHLRDVDVAILEFNHDLEMLLQGPYPWWLKQRVSSSHGHLSNEQAAALLERVASPRLRHLVLAHLSHENNRPARARAAAHAALARSQATAEVQVTVGSQTHPSPVLTLETP